MQSIIEAAWLQQGIPPDIDLSTYDNLVDLFRRSVSNYGSNPAFSSLGYTLHFDELDRRVAQFTRYLQQHTNLKPGDRIAIQLPNLVQYPVVLFAALQAGLVVVNTNPLYSARELEHQLNDSGARAIVVLANVGEHLQQIIAHTQIEQVIVTELADLHPPLRRWFINNAARYIKRMVPKLVFPNSISLLDALRLGGDGEFHAVAAGLNDLAILQYTGGTTGIAKGAMLSHGNILANVLQSQAMFETFDFKYERETMVMPLPLYHIYTFINSLLMLSMGNHSVLVPNPRDINTVIKAMADYPMTCFVGLNTLFVALCQQPSFRKLDFSRLTLTLSGGMALTQKAAEDWQAITGCEINQGYGLTETSPVISVNPCQINQVATIGLPVPATEIKIVDDDKNEMPVGSIGELCVKGPQLMLGYWQRPDETAKVIDEQGWFHTGDIALLQPDGYLKIVDRKKDMILVSGFNVYPNELEDVLATHPKVLESAAIGVPDERTGESVKMFVVVREPVSAEELKAFCHEQLAGYKVPREFVFIDQLPKSSVGKVLRKELR